MQVELLDRKRWRTRVELASAIFEYLKGTAEPPRIPVRSRSGFTSAWSTGRRREGRGGGLASGGCTGGGDGTGSYEGLLAPPLVEALLPGGMEEL